jgi:hypothetical protein
MRPSVAEAIQMLHANPNDARALGTLGGWFAHCGAHDWAVECYRQARALGFALPSLELAVSLDILDRRGEALDAYREALTAAADEDERLHLQLCIEALGARSSTAPGSVSRELAPR